MKKMLIFVLLVLFFSQLAVLNAQEVRLETGITVQTTQAQYLGKTPPIRFLIPRQPMDPDKRKAMKQNKKVPPQFFSYRPTRPNDQSECPTKRRRPCKANGTG